MTKETALEHLISHAIHTLPESLSDRKRTLECAGVCAEGDMRKRIRTMLDFLESHERQQLEFEKIFPL